MIRFTQGNLLSSPAEALVNTVNEVGVMGKGIARMFREAFPAAAREYERAAAAGSIQVGRVLLTPNSDLVGPRWIIHFPTKRHWRNPSKLEWIRTGLTDLVRVVRDAGIRSIALPPLGCGNGGLEWSQVRPVIELALAELSDVDVVVFEPTDAYQSAPKRSGAEGLTPARALITELVRRYTVLGYECTILEAQKLAWFLERSIAALGLPDPLDLRFEANRYGPYAHRLQKLLDNLDGSYLHSEKRIGDAKPLDPIWFEETRRAELHGYLSTDDARIYGQALEVTSQIIEGFESPLGMELLSTVDWLLTREFAEPTVTGIRAALARWPAGGADTGERKNRLFDERMLGLALERLGASALATAATPNEV